MEAPQYQANPSRNSTPVRLLPYLVHVLPAALIQFMDFVTDVFVLTYLYKNDGAPFFGAWKVGVGAISFSLLASWYNIIIYNGCWGTSCLTTWEIIIASLLAPINLHVLAIAMIFATRADN